MLPLSWHESGQQPRVSGDPRCELYRRLGGSAVLFCAPATVSWPRLLAVYGEKRNALRSTIKPKIRVCVPAESVCFMRVKPFPRPRTPDNLDLNARTIIARGQGVTFYLSYMVGRAVPYAATTWNETQFFLIYYLAAHYTKITGCIKHTQLAKMSFEESPRSHSWCIFYFYHSLPKHKDRYIRTVLLQNIKTKKCPFVSAQIAILTRYYY